YSFKTLRSVVNLSKGFQHCYESTTCLSIIRIPQYSINPRNLHRLSHHQPLPVCQSYTHYPHQHHTMDFNTPPPRPATSARTLSNATTTLSAFLYPASTPYPFRHHLRLALRERVRELMRYFALFRYGDPATGVPSNAWIVDEPVEQLRGDRRLRGRLEELRADLWDVWNDLMEMDRFLSSEGPWAANERRDMLAREGRGGA
ncbi:hypothetical protein P171DRAFT_508657, partial [Karstenula rhodostoma CBS 690.94]